MQRCAATRKEGGKKTPKEEEGEDMGKNQNKTGKKRGRARRHTAERARQMKRKKEKENQVREETPVQNDGKRARRIMARDDNKGEGKEPSHRDDGNRLGEMRDGREV